MAAVNHKGDTALFRAAFSRSVPKLQYLINNGLDINTPNHYGLLPLHASIEHSSLDVVQFLVNNGADINAETNEGESVLYFGCRSFEKGIVPYLIDKGVDVLNKKTRGNGYPYVLEQALRNQFLDATNVKILVKNGMNFKGETSNDIRYLFAALSHNVGIACIKYMVEEHGFDLNGKDSVGNTILHKAVRNKCCSLDVVKYLVHKGADISIRTKKGETILHLACRRFLGDIAGFLIEKGCDIHARDKHGLTPIQVAARAGCKQAISLLVNRGADIGIKSKRGDSLLHQVCLNVTPQTCSVHARIRIGHPSWWQMCMHQSYDELEYLLSKFECVNINDTNDYGDSPLHLACRNLPPNIIKKLLDKGARHDIANANGNTPIHLALIKGDLQTILHLLRSGANMYAINDAGKMPIAMCRNDSELRESVIMLYIKSSLPLDKLYTGMMQWNPKPSIHEVLWFCVAGGVPEEHVLLSYLPHITDQSCLDILFSTCPLYLRNNMGNVNTITLELSTYYKTIIDSYINTFPTLATICRQCIRKLFSNKCSLLPQLKALYGEILITKPVFLYLCLLDNMRQTNHKHVRAICKFLGTELDFKKYDIEPENNRLNPPNTPLYDDNMESPTAIQNPRWILDELAQTCPYHLTSAKLSVGKSTW